jgi:antitoxin FitA
LALFWLHFPAERELAMGVNFSIKNVPEGVAALLKERAKKNHRSLQGELMSILEEAAASSLNEVSRGSREPDFMRERRARPVLTIREAFEHMRALGVKTEDDSTQIIRRARDERYGR